MGTQGSEDGDADSVTIRDHWAPTAAAPPPLAPGMQPLVDTQLRGAPQLTLPGDDCVPRLQCWNVRRPGCVRLFGIVDISRSGVTLELLSLFSGNACALWLMCARSLCTGSCLCNFPDTRPL